MSKFNKKSTPAPATVAPSVPTPHSNEASPIDVLGEGAEPLTHRSTEILSTEVLGEDASRSMALGIKPTAKPSILSNGFEFEGVIKSDGVLNISSTLKGKVFAKSIFLDVDGLVEGEIQAEVLTIKGKIFGEIHCQDLTVGSRAVIDGSCFYRTINIQRGGRISGKLTRVE